MPTLRERQRSFAAAIFAAPEGDSSGRPGSFASAAAAGIGIYRQHVHERFRRALALEFPVIARLIGGGAFAHLARDFQRAHPSRAGYLQPIGAPFPRFVARRFGGGRFDYLAHVARLEWAVQECLSAPAQARLDPRTLAHVPARSCAELVLRLHPACQLFHSRYPAARIWRTHRESAAPPLIHLREGATRVLLRRSGAGVDCHELGRAEFALLQKIAQDEPLGVALDAALRIEAGFDPAALLCRLSGWGAIVAAYLAPAARAAG